MAKIGVFDSGVGGLSIFREIRKLLPEEQFVFYADNANCPYGEKTPEFIIQRAKEITSLLLSKGCEVIVVACNTATAAAIATLRKEFDQISFIGIEPALKPAVKLTRSGVVGVLATAGTLGGAKYRVSKQGLEEYKVEIQEHRGEGFVELVEEGLLSGAKAEQVVSHSLQPLLDKGADVIVLGCTHYPFLMQTIRKIAGEGVIVLDPAPAVAHHLVDVMSEKGIEISHKGYEIELIASGSPEALNRTYSLIQ